jgi:hypothetical protein
VTPAIIDGGITTVVVFVSSLSREVYPHGGSIVDYTPREMGLTKTTVNNL